MLVDCRLVIETIGVLCEETAVVAPEHDDTGAVLQKCLELCAVVGSADALGDVQAADCFPGALHVDNQRICMVNQRRCNGYDRIEIQHQSRAVHGRDGRDGLSCFRK